MTWFKVDDGLHAHRKAVRAGVPAMGLWVLAGSWSADQLTDGWVPDYIAAKLDHAYKGHAKSLVAAGLWIPGEHDGDKGWWFHQWAEQQPSREQVLNDRHAAAERQRRARERAKERRNDAANSGDHHAVSHAVTDTVTHAQLTPPVTVPPTRPDPTRPVLPTEVPKEDSLRSSSSAPTTSHPAPRTTRATRINGDFKITDKMRDWAAAEAPGVDLRRETERFIDYYRAAAGSKGTKTDWPATWRNWIRKAHDDTNGTARPRNNGWRPHLNPTDPHAYDGYRPHATEGGNP